MKKTLQIFEVLGVNPHHETVDVIYSIVNGGKSDVYEKASNICAYLDISDDNKDKIIDILNNFD